MLGRNGYKWAYEETVVMETIEEAEGALKTFIPNLEKLDDYSEGRIKLDIFTDVENLPNSKAILRLRQSWKSNHNVRFITDGNHLGINVKPNKVLGDQVYCNVESTTEE